MLTFLWLLIKYTITFFASYIVLKGFIGERSATGWALILGVLGLIPYVWLISIPVALLFAYIHHERSYAPKPAGRTWMPWDDDDNLKDVLHGLK